MPLLMKNKQIIDSVTRVLGKDDRVVFAYVYGSMVSDEKGNDIDIGVYADPNKASNSLSIDLLIEMHRQTGLPPETFDVRLLGEVIEQSDVFGLLYLKSVVDGGRVLVDKDPDVRADFLERYGLRFRECEGLMQEVLA
jgi:predicted nucleotidyltransferase